MSLAFHSATPAEGKTAERRVAGSRVLIAFNPTAGAGGRQAKVQELMQHLRGLGLEAEVSTGPDLLVEEAGRLSAAGELRAVIAAGGDGTASMVMNRLPSGIPIATFPLGTENLLARYLGHSSNPATLAKLVQEGWAVHLDAGQANGRLFSLMAGCGFDAEVVDRLHRERRGPISHWSYIMPMLRTMRRYAYPALRVQIDDAPAFECRWAFVVNMPRYAMRLQFDAAASPLDGLLNVVTFPQGSLASGMRYLAAVYLGRHLRCPGVKSLPARRVRIESVKSAKYQLDGDPGGDLPVEIVCLPGRLCMIVARDWANNAIKTHAPG